MVQGCPQTLSEIHPSGSRIPAAAGISQNVEKRFKPLGRSSLTGRDNDKEANMGFCHASSDDIEGWRRL